MSPLLVLILTYDHTVAAFSHTLLLYKGLMNVFNRAFLLLLVLNKKIGGWGTRGRDGVSNSRVSSSVRSSGCVARLADAATP